MSLHGGMHCCIIVLSFICAILWSFHIRKQSKNANTKYLLWWKSFLKFYASVMSILHWRTLMKNSNEVRLAIRAADSWPKNSEYSRFVCSAYFYYQTVCIYISPLEEHCGGRVFLGSCGWNRHGNTIQTTALTWMVLSQDKWCGSAVWISCFLFITVV